jgi:hypothetical protein
MLVRYHLDESVDPAIAVGLRRRGVDVTTSSEQGLLGTTDQGQLDFATSEQRMLVTHDQDFLRLAAAGAKHHGIAYCPPQARAIGEIVRRLMQLWRERQAEDFVGRIEFL